MPKKRLLHHISLVPVEDKEVKSKIAAPREEIELDALLDEDEPVIRKLYITPAGYPIRPFDAPESIQLNVADEKLFQAYAIEQWIGLSVSKNDYIFDQLIIPDYAFKILKIIPKKSHRISAVTNFILEQPIPPKPTFRSVSFNDIVGNLQAKEKAHIIIEYLKSPKKFGKWGPKNILFYGPPGTGKTLMAKAIASIADCNFIPRKGTALIGLHVGDGANKIHQLYAEAKSNAPAIIFIDELDSIGLNRGFQSVRGDVVEVSTALLAELDGLDENLGVITIGATNGVDLLDPGLRSRFEEEILFAAPTQDERKQMLLLFAKDSPIPFEMDPEVLAIRTDNWSGRDLHEKLMKVAIHQAIRQKKSTITMDMLLKMIDTIQKQKQQGDAPSGVFI